VADATSRLQTLSVASGEPNSYHSNLRQWTLPWLSDTLSTASSASSPAASSSTLATATLLAHLFSEGGRNFSGLHRARAATSSLSLPDEPYQSSGPALFFQRAKTQSGGAPLPPGGCKISVTELPPHFYSNTIYLPSLSLRTSHPYCTFRVPNSCTAVKTHEVCKGIFHQRLHTARPGACSKNGNQFLTRGRLTWSLRRKFSSPDVSADFPSTPMPKGS
jgi:hypothetical protein